MARSPSRHRPKLEPITISELEADPTMVGFTSLFRIPTTEMPLSHLLPPGMPPVEEVESALTVAEAALTVDAVEPTAAEGLAVLGRVEGPAPTVGSDLAPTLEAAAPAFLKTSPEPTVGFGLTHTVGLEPLETAPLLSEPTPAAAGSATSLPPVPFGAQAAVSVDSDTVDEPAPTVGPGPVPTVATLPDPVMPADAPISSAPTVGFELTPTLAATGAPAKSRPVRTPQPGARPVSGSLSAATPAPTVGSGPVPPDPATATIWQTESGEIFTGKRARRIQRAQDALTHAEETVYDALWGSRTTGADRERMVRIGYDRLAALARVNEKSARLIIPRLVEKGFLEIHAPADPNRRLGTEYRVFGYGAVLEHQRRRGRQWVLRSGNGVFYVRPVASLTAVVAGVESPDSPPSASPVSDGLGPEPTVGHEVSVRSRLPEPTVGAGPTVTVGTRPTDTVGAAPTDTVGAAPTVSLDSDLGKHRQSPSSVVYHALSRYAVADDDAVKALVSRCRMQAPDATEEEMAACIEEKGRVIASGRIDNPIAFLLVYVPKCFAGEWLKEFRRARWALAQAEQEREREAREWDARERERLTAVLADPSASAEDQAWARQYLGLSD